MPIQGDFSEFVTAALYSVGQTSNVCWTWEQKMFANTIMTYKPSLLPSNGPKSGFKGAIGENLSIKYLKINQQNVQNRRRYVKDVYIL